MSNNRNSTKRLASLLDLSIHLVQGMVTYSALIEPHDKQEYCRCSSCLGGEALPHCLHTGYEWDGTQGIPRSLPSMSKIRSAPSQCFSCMGCPVGKDRKSVV